MQLRTRILVIILASLLGLLIMAGVGLHALRQSLYEERRAQISQLLDFSESLVKHYYALETTGKLSREDAEARAKEAIAAQKHDNDYFFIRNLNDNYFILHPISSRLGKPDDGGKTPDGRIVVEAYRQGLENSPDHKAYIQLAAPKPGLSANKSFAKLNGVLKFEPWGWMIGIGFFIDDIEARFWRQANNYLVIGSLLLAILALLLLRMRSSILRQLGGDPAAAAESMRKIANGDLSISIRLAQGDDSSMMASLKLMQMKLSNITTSIKDNTATLAEQVGKFDEAAKVYAGSHAEEHLPPLLKAAARIGKTAEILNRSIARFKL